MQVLDAKASPPMLSYKVYSRVCLPENLLVCILQVIPADLDDTLKVEFYTFHMVSQSIHSIFNNDSTIFDFEEWLLYHSLEEKTGDS